MLLERLARLLIVVFGVSALAPPHPDGGEDLREYHRKLREPEKGRIKPRFIDAAICHDLSEKECLAMDQAFERHTRKLQRIMSEQGVVRVLVICMRFLNHHYRWVPPTRDYEFLLSGSDIHDTIAPTGSVRSFLEANSYNNVKFEFDVMPWITTEETEAFYSYNRSGRDTRFGYSMYPVFDALEHWNLTDWGRYDLDNDGVIDNLLLLHSGYPAEIGGLDCYNDATHHQRIWSHAGYFPNNRWVSPSTGIGVEFYATAPALRGLCWGNIGRIGVITHELLHLLGLPDLYDPGWIGRGTGHYDIMSNAHGRNWAGTHPSYLTPWSKMKLGWLQPIEITHDGLYDIEASEISNNIYIVSKGYPQGEYFLVENRQPIRWDSLLWGGGLLIWHIDTTRALQRQRGYPGQNGWPGNNKHYEIALMQADKQYHIEMGTNWGDDGDYYRDAGAEIGPAPVELEATNPDWYPNTNAYRFGEIYQTGLRIHDISPSNTTMTFRVSGLDSAPPTMSPPSTTTPTHTPTYSPSLRIMVPSSTPSSPPSAEEPSMFPSMIPSVAPSMAPTKVPSVFPSMVPTFSPSIVPSTTVPTFVPSTTAPTFPPTPTPSSLPSEMPSFYPSTKPSFVPSWHPSRSPTQSPSKKPSPVPTRMPDYGKKPSSAIMPSFSPSNNSPLASPSLVPSMTWQPTQPVFTLPTNPNKPEKAAQKLSNGYGGAGGGA